MDKVKKALEGDDTEAVKSAMDELNQKAQSIGQALYAQAQQSPQNEAPAGDQNASSADDDVIDAEVVDDEDSSK